MIKNLLSDLTGLAFRNKHLGFGGKTYRLSMVLKGLSEGMYTGPQY